MRQETRDRFSGTVESFTRRSGSAGLHGDPLRHRSSDDVPSSKDVVRITNFRSFAIIDKRALVKFGNIHVIY